MIEITEKEFQESLPHAVHSLVWQSSWMIAETHVYADTHIDIVLIIGTTRDYKKAQFFRTANNPDLLLEHLKRSSDLQVSTIKQKIVASGAAGKEFYPVIEE
ncbi:MAG: hypothetical protein PVI90_09260 [Desulfobacteraceae bacterium]|jgi:hypothetical protein